MPRYVAVEGPYAGVVCVVLRDDMSAWPQHLGIATLRVLRVDKGLIVVEAVAFVKDVHVVAVEVHWLGLWVSVDASFAKILIL